MTYCFDACAAVIARKYQQDVDKWEKIQTHVRFRCVIMDTCVCVTCFFRIENRVTRVVLMHYYPHAFIGGSGIMSSYGQSQQLHSSPIFAKFILPSGTLQFLFVFTILLVS